MDDEPFNGDYFRHLLASLTLNSRALIVELTSIAEQYPDDAAFMVDTIEERINKILPKYKLFSFYLMDSIVKNVGNPYNLLFAKNIFKLFTETYLIVDDTTTRQNLINLFKTWMTGKTSAGLDLFPHEVLLRIEKFIIRATSLGQASGAHQDGAQPHASRISRDVILREGNYLLQYIIAMDEDLEKITAQSETSVDSAKGKDPSHVPPSPKVHELRSNRNKIIFEINSISESVMAERKDEFDARKEEYLRRLQEIRGILDRQSEEQTAMSQSLFSAPSESPERLQVPCVLQPPSGLNVDLILGQDDVFEAYVEAWGKPSVHTTAMFSKEAKEAFGKEAKEAFEREVRDCNDSNDFNDSNDSNDSKEDDSKEDDSKEVNDSIDSKEFNANLFSQNASPLQQKPTLEAVAVPNPSELASSLGINIESFNFDEYNSSVTTADKDLDLDDDDGYDPESTIIEDKHSPPTSPIHGGPFYGKSSLKRPISGDSRPTKRVRFDV